MKISKNLKTERRKRVVKALAKGLLQVVNSMNKSNNINDLEKIKKSENVDKQLDNLEDKSVCGVHEIRKNQ